MVMEEVRMGFHERDGMDDYEKRWSISNEEGCGFGLVG